MRIILLFLSLLSTIIVFGQKSTERFDNKSIGWISLIGGVNVPLGSFNNDKFESDAGWAEVGWMAKADIGFVIYENIGLVLSPTIFHNPIDESSIGQTIYAVGATKSEKEQDPWKFMGVFLGPEFRLPSIRSPFFIRAQLGYLHCTSPYFSNYVGDAYGTGAFLKQEAVTANAVATSIGCGFKFNLNDIVQLNIVFDYVSVKPEFKDVLLTFNNNGKYEYQTISFKQHVTSLFPSLGLSWRL